jgi:hypothetical protein
MGQLAKSQGLQGAARQKAVDAQVNRGFFGSAKDAWKGEGPLGRRGALENMAGGLSQTAGEFILPGIAMSALAPRQAAEGQGVSPQATQPMAPPYANKMGQDTTTAYASRDTLTPPKPLLTSMAGGVTGGLSAGVLSDLLKAKGVLPSGPSGTILGRAIPAVGSLTGSLSGYALGHRLWPTPHPEIALEEKMNQLDFDKLMRYYKKREDAESQGV